MIQTRRAKVQDISGVIELQSLYLYANLSEKERTAGFVTTPFTQEQIRQIVQSDGLFIAEDNGKIIAYAYAGDWTYFAQWPIFPFMTARFPQLHFKDWNITTENSFQYGPVCIDLPNRGKGLLNQLFEEMRLAWVEKYPLSITFINQVNQPSIKAHTQKLGWEIIDDFNFNNKQYYGLAFDMKRSVI